MCDACNRRCSIPEGSHGFCYVRKNVGGKLHLSVYGKLAAMQIDPIEKKPFNHFHPGTHVFTVGTISCNWHCHPAGTQITLADGSTKSVESLAKGDALWSYDVTSDDMSKSKPRPNVVTEIRDTTGGTLGGVVGRQEGNPEEEKQEDPDYGRPSCPDE